MKQLIGIYYILDKTYHVYAVYDYINDLGVITHDRRNIDYYDVIDEYGQNINTNDVFFSFPSWDDVYNLLITNHETKF